MFYSVDKGWVNDLPNEALAFLVETDLLDPGGAVSFLSPAYLGFTLATSSPLSSECFTLADLDFFTSSSESSEDYSFLVTFFFVLF